MTNSATRTIAIIGSGFCGTVVATNLLRSADGPLRIVLIERSTTVGCGAAYTSRDYPFLLNVPAARMSATTAAPLQFLEFAQTRVPTAGPDDFLPRELYGEYLCSLLVKAQREATDILVEKWSGEVEEVRRLDAWAPYSKLGITTTDGHSLVADAVVLAVGAPRYKAFNVAEHVAHHPAYIADPLRAATPPAGKTLFIGSGLTMADAVCASAASSRTLPVVNKFVAISRHGLIPPEQTSFKPSVIDQEIASSLRLAAAISLRRLTRVVRSLARSTEERGGDWREVITLVRHVAPGLWLALRQPERARFLRHLHTFWDVHRHRLPTAVRNRLDHLRAQGRLDVHAGRIRRIVPQGSQLAVHWQPRRSTDLRIELFDRVVNCSGPDYRITYSGDALWRTLLRTGLATPDPLHTGVRTSAGLELIDSDGAPTPTLYYVGSLLRAGFWEATAVAELRAHCERLAARVLAQVSHSQEAPAPRQRTSFRQPRALSPF